MIPLDRQNFVVAPWASNPNNFRTTGQKIFNHENESDFVTIKDQKLLTIDSLLSAEQ
jgi:hypothetical protein